MNLTWLNCEKKVNFSIIVSNPHMAFSLEDEGLWKDINAELPTCIGCKVQGLGFRVQV